MALRSPEVARSEGSCASHRNRPFPQGCRASDDVWQVTRKAVPDRAEAPDFASMRKSEVRSFTSRPRASKSMTAEAHRHRKGGSTRCRRRDANDKRIQVPETVGSPGDSLRPPTHAISPPNPE